MVDEKKNPPAEDEANKGGGNEHEEKLTIEQLAARTNDMTAKLRNADRTNKKLNDELGSVKSELDGLKSLIGGETGEELKSFLAERREQKEKQLVDDEAKGRKLSLSDQTTNAEIRRLEKQLSDIQKQREEDRKKSDIEKRDIAAQARAKAHRGAVQQLVAESSVLDPASAVDLLVNKTQWDEANEVLLATVKTESGDDETITLKGRDALRKAGVLSPIFFPPDGVQGTGSRGSGAAGGKAFDLDGALTGTQADFVKNRDKIRAAMKARRAVESGSGG